jgi:HSP20 family protein
MFGITRRKEESLPLVREFEPLARLHTAMDELFSRFMTRFWPEERAWFRPGFEWETEEKENELVMKAELPGFEPAEINLELMGNELRLHAEHEEEKKEGEKNDGTMRRHGRVEYAMTLPAGVEPEKMEAMYRNGILEVHLPRKPEAKGRRIDVKT